MGGELSKNMLLDFYKDITYSTLHTVYTLIVIYYIS